MVKQYEIYMLNLDPTIGSEMNKTNYMKSSKKV